MPHGIFLSCITDGSLERGRPRGSGLSNIPGGVGGGSTQSKCQIGYLFTRRLLAGADGRSALVMPLRPFHNCRAQHRTSIRRASRTEPGNTSSLHRDHGHNAHISERLANTRRNSCAERVTWTRMYTIIRSEKTLILKAHRGIAHGGTN
jgi:hypothetical protein